MLNMIMKNKNLGPYTCIFHVTSDPKYFSKKGVNIWEPSNGDTGRRLNTASVILICIKIIRNVLILLVNRSVLNNNRSAKAATTAK